MLRKSWVVTWLFSAALVFALVPMGRADTIQITVCATSNAPGTSGASCNTPSGDTTTAGSASTTFANFDGVAGTANGQTYPSAPQGTLIGFNYDFNNHNTAQTTIYVWVSADNVTGGNGLFNFQETLNSITGNGAGNVTLNAFEANTSSSFFQTDNLLGSLSVNGNLMTASGSSTVSGLSSTYSLTEEFAVTLDPGVHAQVTGQIGSAVPEPSSLLMLASGLLPLTRLRRRWFR